MTNNKQLRANARAALKGSYGTGFLVVLLSAGISFLVSMLINQIATAGVGASLLGVFTDRQMLDNLRESNRDPALALETLQTLIANIIRVLPALIIGGLITALVLLLIRIFFYNPIEVGLVRWFSRNRETAESASVGHLFGLFRGGGAYMGAVSGMFWKQLWLFIWGLPTILVSVGFAVYFWLQHGGMLSALANTFMTDFYALQNVDFVEIGRRIFPSLILMNAVIGVVSTVVTILVIIKGYAYGLAEWIIADNPVIGARRALNLSKAMTRGNKGRMFLLDLSFIGWFLLAIIAGCFVCAPITLLILMPYFRAAHAERYAALRDEAVSKGIVSMEELGYRLVSPPPPQNPPYGGYGGYPPAPQAPPPVYPPYQPYQPQQPAAPPQDTHQRPMATPSYDHTHQPLPSAPPLYDPYRTPAQPPAGPPQAQVPSEYGQQSPTPAPAQPPVESPPLPEQPQQPENQD